MARRGREGADIAAAPTTGVQREAPLRLLLPILYLQGAWRLAAARGRVRVAPVRNDQTAAAAAAAAGSGTAAAAFFIVPL